jgi:CubicO group peptidase (beta-lactamase class C family)
MPLTRRSLLKWGAATVGAAGLGSAGIVIAAASLPDALRRILDDAVAQGAAPGIQLAVWQRGTPLAAYAAGTANLETGTAASIGSVFRIGSLTKQFAAALAAALAEQGKLDLDAPASHYLPSFRGKPAFSVLELIHHTAGLHSDEEGEALAGEITQARLAEAIAAQATLFDFPPGTAWRYSNANYHVLGAILEQVAGQPLAVVGRTLLFDRLGMAHTAFDHDGDIVPGRATGYAFGDGDPPVLRNAPCIDIAQAGAAGAMRGTADDLCRWHAALLDGRVLDAAGLRAVLAPARLRDGRPGSAHRARAEDAAMGATEYGFGLLLDRATRDGSLIVQHNGFIAGFSAYLATHVPSRLTVACLCNADPNPGLPFRALRRAVFAELLAPSR